MSRVPLAARVRPPADRTLRVRHRMVQTPVVRFVHRKTGRTVTFVGVTHIGQASYYRQIHIILTRVEAAGALIFYEGLGPAAGPEWSATSQAEIDGWNAATTDRRELTQAACRHLGWVRQGAAMSAAVSWQNVDMTDLEFVQRSGARALAEQQEAFEDVLGNRSRDQRDVLTGVGLAMMMRLTSLDRYKLALRWASTANPDFSQMVVDDRNERALAALPPDRDSALIWGCEHLPGLAAGLRGAGYLSQASAWLNVGELPPLWASAKAVWAVLREGQLGDRDGADQGSASAGSSGM